MLTKIIFHLHKLKNPWKPFQSNKLTIQTHNLKKRKYPDVTVDKPFMESGACPPFITPSKQDEDRDCDLIPVLSLRKFTFQSHL